MPAGDVNLIAKIAPKNKAFTVIVDAANAGIADAGNLYTGTTVEAALQEIGAGIVAPAAQPSMGLNSINWNGRTVVSIATGVWWHTTAAGWNLLHATPCDFMASLGDWIVISWASQNLGTWRTKTTDGLGWTQVKGAYAGEWISDEFVDFEHQGTKILLYSYSGVIDDLCETVEFYSDGTWASVNNLAPAPTPRRNFFTKYLYGGTLTGDDIHIGASISNYNSGKIYLDGNVDLGTNDLSALGDCDLGPTTVNGDFTVQTSKHLMTSAPLVHAGTNYDWVAINTGSGAIVILDKSTFGITSITKDIEPVLTNADGIEDWAVGLVTLDFGGSTYVYLTMYFKDSDFVGGTNPSPGTADDDYVDTWLTSITGITTTCEYFKKGMWTNGATPTDDYVWANPDGKTIVTGYTTHPTFNYATVNTLNTDDLTGYTTVRSLVETYPTLLTLDQVTIPQVMFFNMGQDGYVKATNGVLDVDDRVFIVGSDVPNNETDPQFNNWLSGPPDISTFTNNLGYLTAEVDTLASVTARGSSTTAACYFQHSEAISLGLLGTANIPGRLRLFSNGTQATNPFFTDIFAGTQTEFITYYLPNAGVGFGQNGFLKCDGSGTMSWDTTTYVSGTPWTGLYLRLAGESTDVTLGTFDLTTTGNLDIGDLSLKGLFQSYILLTDDVSGSAQHFGTHAYTQFGGGFSDGGGYGSVKVGFDLQSYRYNNPIITVAGGNESVKAHSFKLWNYAKYSSTQNYDITGIGIDGYILSDVDWDGAGKACNVTNCGGLFVVTSTEKLTAGTMQVTNTGAIIQMYENSAGSTVHNTFLQFQGACTSANSAMVRDTMPYHWYFTANNKKLILGATYDTSLYYDGSAFVINPKDSDADVRLEISNYTLGALGDYVMLKGKSDGTLSDLFTVSNYLVIVSDSTMGMALLGFVNSDGTSGAGITANFTDDCLYANWDWNPETDDSYSLGNATHRWVDGRFTGTVYVPEIDSSAAGATDLTITTGAQKTLVLVTPVWNDLVCPMFVGKTGTSNVPTFQAFVGVLTAYRFAADDYLETCTELIHDYKEGTDLEVHIHWATNGVDVDNRAVKWEVVYSIANMNTGAFSGTTTLTGQTTIPANTTDRTHLYTSMSSLISGAGRKIGDVILMRIRRIAATGGLSAPSANPFGLNLGIHYEIDTMGSRQMGIK